MKLVTILCMVFFACTLTSFHSAQKQRDPNESISGYTSTLSGANDVLVILSRSGPEAGYCDVCFDLDISFNDGPCQTFHFCMSQGETYRQEHIQGPNPTAFASECGAPYNITYSNCPY
jgi:hypothetical protein